MEIIVKNLTKKFENKIALDDISLVVGQGMFGLLGQNGAGKTTLMRIITTLLNKTAGEVTVCGIPVEKSGEVRRMVGYLPQDFDLYPGMRVGDALDYLGILSGMDRKTRKGNIQKVLRQVNLSNCKNLKVKALSGGMKRRLGIAQAILHDPKVLIVDEPTAGLDPEERIRFRNLLSELAKDRIVMLSTHIVEDIQSTCENIAILDQGKLLYQGSVQELMMSAREHVFTAAVNKDAADAIKEQYLVTGLTGYGNEVNIRILAEEKPFEEAVICEPTMEDAYMYRLQQEKTKGKYEAEILGTGGTAHEVH